MHVLPFGEEPLGNIRRLLSNATESVTAHSMSARGDGFEFSVITERLATGGGFITTRVYHWTRRI